MPHSSSKKSDVYIELFDICKTRLFYGYDNVKPTFLSAEKENNLNDCLSYKNSLSCKK